MAASWSADALALPRGTRGRAIALAGLTSLALLALAAALYGTRLGVGLANDSVNYLRAARGLLEGKGLIVLLGHDYAGPEPMTDWPPLYPLLLAAAGWLGLDMEGFARAVNALLFAANVLLIGRVVLDHGGGAIGALVVALLFATNRDVLYVHQMALTEPIFLFTTVLALALLARHLRAPRAALVWSAGLCAALALLTRYVGIAVVGAGGLGLLLLARAPLRERVRDALRFAALPVAALSIWALRNRLVVDETSYERWNPTLPQLAPLLESIASALTRWIWPFSTSLVGWGARSATLGAALLVGACAAIALAGVGAVRARAPGNGHPSCAARLFALYALCHLAFVYGTVIAFYDAFVPNPRQLLPATLALVIAFACVAPRLSARAAKPRLFAFAAGIALGALLLTQATYALRNQRARAESGIGFRAAHYTGSDLVSIARALPPGTPVFSNTHLLAGLVPGLDMRMLPTVRKSLPRTDANPAYAEQMRDMERVLREQNGRIIVFAGMGDLFPRVEQLERELPLQLLLEEPQGHAFALDPAR